MLKNFYKTLKTTDLSILSHENFCSTYIDIEWSLIEYNRISFINNAVKNFKNCKYLEIGCDNNKCFHSIFAKNKVGIDPVRGGNIRTTSDNFFLENKVIFDVIFIDGLHVYEQVRKDVENSLNFLNINGFLFLHDLTPRNFLEENVPRLQPMWTGDVWKVAIELAKTKGIDFFVINADNEVGILKKKNNKVTLFNDYLNLKNKKFKDFLELNEVINYINPQEANDFINQN
jgi:hypothetical protein